MLELKYAIDRPITRMKLSGDLNGIVGVILLLFAALGHTPPRYLHCPLMRDENNVRLAKRHDALSLRTLRSQGVLAGELRKKFAEDLASIRELTPGL